MWFNVMPRISIILLILVRLKLTGTFEFSKENNLISGGRKKYESVTQESAGSG